MAEQLVTPPSQEPVTLAEAKTHLRVEVDTEDALISGLIASARQWAENETNRALVTQTWRLWLDAFPSFLPSTPRAEIVLPNPPLATVTAIAYTASDGTSLTLDPSLYTLDKATEPGRVMPAWGTNWPSTRDVANAVSVTYTAGYGDPAAVPEGIRRAILQYVGSFYDHREGGPKPDMLTALRRLLDPSRIRRLL